MTEHVMTKAAVVGHRSFIAKALIEELCLNDVTVHSIPKSELETTDFTGYACVYLILGRARPTSDEEREERLQLDAFLNNPNPPARAIYISSMNSTESKRWCESRIRDRQEALAWNQRSFIRAIRPAAVFGPMQDPTSEMLVPSLVREGADSMHLRAPNQLTPFISVHDLVRHLARFAGPSWFDHNFCGEPGSIFDVPGTFRMTPHQMRELFVTFEGLAARAKAEH